MGIGGLEPAGFRENTAASCATGVLLDICSSTTIWCWLIGGCCCGVMLAAVVHVVVLVTWQLAARDLEQIAKLFTNKYINKVFDH